MTTEVTNRLALTLIDHVREHAEDIKILSVGKVVGGDLFLKQVGGVHVTIARELLATLAKEAAKLSLGVVAIKDTMYRPGALMSSRNVHEPKQVSERSLMEKGYVPVDAAEAYCRAAAERNEGVFVEVRQDVLALPLMVL